MEQYISLLDKIRVIKTQPLLVRFTLHISHEPINCVVTNIEIADELLTLKEGKYTISVTG